MGVIIHLAPERFFAEQLLAAAQSQGKTVAPVQLAYVSTMLSDFIASENFFQVKESGKAAYETLALLYKEAVDCGQTVRALELFKRMGDVSMVVSGFFSDHLNTRLVDVDYYLGMGTSAYSHVAQRSRNEDHQALFNGLSREFQTYVNLVSEVSERSFAESKFDPLRTYEKWLKTGNTFLAKKLQENGITPIDQDDTEFKQ